MADRPPLRARPAAPASPRSQASREASRRSGSFGPRWWRERRGGLRWLLGASYMRVTLAAVAVVELLGLVLLAQGVLYANGRFHPVIAGRLGPVAADLLEANGDPEALQAFIDRPVSVRDEGPPLSVAVPRPPQGYTLVLDATGDVWFDNRRFAPTVSTDPAASDPDASMPDPAATRAPAPVRRLDRTLAERAIDTGEARTRQGLIRTMHAAPLRSDDGRVIGALLLVSTLQPATPGLVLLGLVLLAIATVLVVLIGTVFGLYASRPLARRIEELASAADAWSRGDFSRAVHDPGDDELGRLSRRLDRMAGQLRDLVRARQALAGSRERTRIARELHDSVKQQVFAASMRLGAARSAPPDQVDVHLASAESLVHQAQQELSDLIHELRPVAVEGRALDEALRALADGYGGSNGPTLELDLEPGLSGTPEVGTALYRIAQEAITNALRHAGAERVTMRLRSDGAAVVLGVEDDGRGFEPERVQGRGVGLSSMAARAEALGGRLRIDSRPGEGTVIEARVPAGGRGAPGAEGSET